MNEKADKFVSMCDSRLNHIDGELLGSKNLLLFEQMSSSQLDQFNGIVEEQLERCNQDLLEIVNECTLMRKEDHPADALATDLEQKYIKLKNKYIFSFK